MKMELLYVKTDMENGIILFGFFVPPDFEDYETYLWNGSDFWYATERTLKEIQEFKNEMRVNKWEDYLNYEVKRIFDLLEEHSVVLPDNVIEVMINYLLEHSRNDKIDVLLQ